MPMPTAEAQREYQRQWMAKRRADWLAGKSCVDCGSVEALEIDHVDAARKVTHRVWSWAEERREAELAKCVVRCTPCHKAKTAKQRLPAHGTTTMYNNHGCRCEECKAAKRVRNATRYKTKG